MAAKTMGQCHVPVLVYIWIRPECQRKQFEVIRRVKPGLIFLASDGGRTRQEQKMILRNRRIYEQEVDWECEIVKIYEDRNLGMYTMGRKVMDIVWSRVDRCILFEDDVIPSESFFYFCEEMLERYLEDERVGLVCGMNHLGVYEDCSSDYFFTTRGSIWGYAMWKRTYEQYYRPVTSDKYFLKLLKKNVELLNPAFWKQIQGFSKGTYYNGHVAGPEFYQGMACYANSQLRIVPKYNLIQNIGCTANAAHSADYQLLPKAIRRVHNLPVYELDFPLKHPEYVIGDEFYTKRVDYIMGNNHPAIQFARKVERWLLAARHGVFCREWNAYLQRRGKHER